MSNSLPTSFSLSLYIYIYIYIYVTFGHKTSLYDFSELDLDYGLSCMHRYIYWQSTIFE